MKEAWKPIAGYVGKYEISNKGTVRSLLFKTRTRPEPKTLKVHVKKDGYCFVVLSINNSPKNLYVHRLVAAAFLNNPNNCPQVNHLNGIKSHNLVDNLEWCTAKQNMRHARKIGLRTTIYRKLTPKSVYEIKANLASGAVVSDLAVKYKVSESLVYRIARGEVHKRIVVE